MIVRRQDDTYCDPLELRSDSILGVPGLVQAVRSGTVTVANALGSGVIESAAPAGFLPALSRHILGEDLKIPGVATWWCGEESALKYVSEHVSALVIKPAFPGLAARYISGYLKNEELVGSQASHPWLAVFCPGFGWLDLDPTNDQLANGNHITLAYGRDYSDVAPVKGVALGGGEQVVNVAVVVKG